MEGAEGDIALKFLLVRMEALVLEKKLSEAALHLEGGILREGDDEDF